MAQLLARLWPPKQERPFLKLCDKCHGKGQISFFDQFQKKLYAPCDHCSNGTGPYALGVSVKCRCQGPSVTYSWALGPDAKHYRAAADKADLKELTRFQKALGAGGTAVLIVCDNCGARYICQDGAAHRRRISGSKEMNEADKEFNKHIAATMVAHGIIKELTDENLGEPFPLVPHPPSRPQSAAATQAFNRQHGSFGAVASGGRMRPMSAPVSRAGSRSSVDYDPEPMSPTRMLPPALARITDDSDGEQEAAAGSPRLPVYAPRLQPRAGAHAAITPVSVK